MAGCVFFAVTDTAYLFQIANDTYEEGRIIDAGWVLTADRKFNGALTFPSQWREAPIVSTAQQFAIGAIFSSPLVVGKTIYFGSTDGNLYALE